MSEVRQHAILSPSGAEKWMGCPASAFMEKGLPDDSNNYSDEGTAAHLLGSTCLETGKDPVEFMGCTIVVGSTDTFDGAAFEGEQDPRFVIRRTYNVDEEMASAVGRYVAEVRTYAEGADAMFPERRIQIGMFTGEEGAAGTADATVVRTREFGIGDLKYGMGHRVSAVRNKQEMIYGLGVREELDLAYGPFDKIRFVIHQPRLEHLSEWDCTNDELTAFGEEVKAAAKKALHIYSTGEYTDADLNPSQDACRWCKAKATCPALAKFVTDATANDFDAVVAAPGEMAGAAAVVPHHPAASLGRKMAAIPLIEDWIKSIRAKVESELFAGNPVPGWKIVQGKKGNRSWTDTAQAEELLKTMRMTVEERYKMTLLGPPAIEKVLKATPKRWARVLKANLIEQKPGGPSVAPESDPRPVWTPPDTTNDFTAVQPEETTA